MAQTAFEQTAIQLGYLRDPRIAALALDRRPVWLWAVDGTHILWANVAGSAPFGARGPLALAARRFDKGMPIAAHVARLAASLTLGNPPRLERLRGLGTALGVPCTCSCSLIEVETGPALLLVASKRSRPGLSVPERAARLIDGLTAPLALFSSQGQLLHAAPAAQEALTAPMTLAFLGAETLAADAWRSGRAAGPSKVGALSIARLGAGPDAALLATIGMIPLALHESYPSHAVPTAPSVTEPDDGAHDDAPAALLDEAATAAPHTAPSIASNAATLTERRHPVRFVWEMDEAGHFDIHSEEFIALFGPATAVLLGRAWQEIRGALALDPENRIARAVATRDTWSAITLAWPIDGTHDRIAVELSGLPVFNRERRFSGYRGFGVCRDVCNDVQDFTTARGDDVFKPAGNEPLVFPLARSTENVVPFRTATGDRAASLSPVEKSAFHELARELALRLQNGMQPGEAAQENATTQDGTAQDDATHEKEPASVHDGAQDHVAAESADTRPADAVQHAAHDGRAGSEQADLEQAQPEQDETGQNKTARANDTVAALAAITAQYDALAHGVLIYTPDRALYANPAFLAWSGYDTLDALATDGGPSAFAVAGLDGRNDVSSGQIITLTAIRAADRTPIPAQLTAIAWPIVAPDGRAREDDTQDGKTRSAETSGEDVWVDAPWDDKAWNDQDLNDNSWKDGAWDEEVRGDEVRNEATACMITLLGGTRELPPHTMEAPREAEVESYKAEPHTPPAPTLPNFALPPEGWQDAAAATNDSQDDATAHPVANAADQSAQALAQATTQTDSLRKILDAAADGVLTFDEGGTVLAATAGAQSLFAVAEDDLVGERFDAMLTPESRAVAHAAFDALVHGTGTKHGARQQPARDVTGRTRFGATLPLLLTLAPVTEAPRRFCAIFRDISTWKAVEQELVTARRQAENASAAKSDFLAKMSHEVRTPLNAIIGFSEVMLSERFGPVDNERYRSYLQDIQASGNHVVSLLNDLLDLSKIEQGKLELAFANVDLNGLTQDCVGIMQAQAAKERIILRVSLANGLPPIIADTTSVKQIILNLLSNAIKFTSAGGQIIVSTALSDTNSVALRIRDTGVGMSEKDVAVALEPFRQLGTAPRLAQKGSGLGLPLTKALAEANRAGFTIKSAINVGTLVEIAFNPARAAAE